MNRATYSPDDNKLRLYVGRVPRDEYEALRADGWTSTPKQECDFVATWTPKREDTALDYLDDGDDIEPEDYSPEERAADRAERFSGYRDKRAAEAHGHADTFESGPAVYGNQSQRRAERQAARHDRHRFRACSQWSKAEYWQTRTAAVISHALYRSSAAVRRSRILRLEAEQRKQEKSLSEYATRFRAWEAVLGMEGLDEIAPQEDYQPWTNKPEITSRRAAPVTAAGKAAYALANSSGCWTDYKHPRRDDDRKLSLWQLMTDPADPITPREAATLWLGDREQPDDPGQSWMRWAAHYVNRLAFERAMLENEGGTAAAADMEPGGWILTGNRTGSVFTNVNNGWKQIHAVNRSPVTKCVTSVKVMGLVGYRDPKPGLVSVNIQRLGEGNYRPPTEEERATFAAETKERKAEAKANAPETIPLINPTDDDAQRLQDLWNALEIDRREKSETKYYNDFVPSTVLRMTQAQYSARSKGNYANCTTVDVCQDGRQPRRKYGSNCDPVPVGCKIRRTSGASLYGTDRVIVISDKTQKPLPIQWNYEAPTTPTVAPAPGNLFAEVQS